MIGLDERIFGNITSKEVIGAEPPAARMDAMLDSELSRLVADLEGMARPELAVLKERQQAIEKEMNSRPGAMVLSQEKIRLFTRYSQRYVQAINEGLAG